MEKNLILKLHNQISSITRYVFDDSYLYQSTLAYQGIEMYSFILGALLESSMLSFYHLTFSTWT